MAASSAAAFWLTALLLIMVPGADWAFVISAGLRGHSAVPAVAGLVLGYAGITAVVAGGVGILIARSPAALTAISVAGGVYLMWHGARTATGAAVPGPPATTPAGAVHASAVRAGPVQAGPARGGPAQGSPGQGSPGQGSPAQASRARAGAERRGAGRAVLVRGIGVSALNPKGLLLLLALLPQFTSPRGAWPLTVQLGFLGVVFMLSVAAFYLCLGSVARTILRARPGAARAVTRCSGAAMIVIGALLLAGRFAH